MLQFWQEKWKRKSTRATILQMMLFIIVTVLYMIWLVPRGSMILESGDAADNWASIITWHTPDRYGSYTLYKGFSAIYPYVWFYYAAVWMHLNPFFFCMLYYAVLFAYVSVIGIPFTAEKMLDYKPKFWQRILLVLFLYVTWERTNALQELMVDLPSCAMYFAALQTTLSIQGAKNKHKIWYVLFTGLLAGMSANISGQYSVAGILLIIAAGISLWSSSFKRGKSVWPLLSMTSLMLAAFFGIKAINTLFYYYEVRPLILEGAWIPSGTVWMERGLIYFIDKNRYLYGTSLMNPRGMAILEDMYGRASANETMAMAEAGAYGWTVKDYLSVVLHYPVDMIVQAVDRFFIIFSLDMRRQSFSFLTLGYSLFYIAVYAAFKRVRQWKDFLSVKTVVVLATLTAVLPSLVMTVEPRVTIGVQGFIFGIAILSESVSGSTAAIGNAVINLFVKDKRGLEKSKTNPWVFIIWFIFLVFCMMHIGTLYAQSNMGTEMLFKLW